MISIIICSINKGLLNHLKLNIEQTIGVAYEIIAVDNRENNEGICKVYNRGGLQASFPILCFVHEDILFQTQDWGLLLLQHFNDDKVGLIGVAGGDTKGIVPSSWSSTFYSKEMNIVQYDKSDSKGKHLFITATPKCKNSVQVLNLDGVFLCTKREVFDEFTFDENNLAGFHGYDIDYSLQVFTRYKVLVVFDILINHVSTGNPGLAWLKSAMIVTKKWKKELPLSVYPLTKEQFNLYHWKSLQAFLERLFYLNLPFYLVVFYYFRYSFTRFFKLRRFLSMGKFVFLSLLNKPVRYEAKEMKHVGKVRAINYN